MRLQLDAPTYEIPTSYGVTVRVGGTKVPFILLSNDEYDYAYKLFNTAGLVQDLILHTIPSLDNMRRIPTKIFKDNSRMLKLADCVITPRDDKFMTDLTRLLGILKGDK